MMGGEIQRSSLNHDMGYSEKAQRTGTKSYLEPISGSLQKPIEGLPSLIKKTEDRVAIGEKHNQKHVENHFAAINKTAQRHPENPNYRNATNATFQKS